MTEKAKEFTTTGGEIYKGIDSGRAVKSLLLLAVNSLLERHLRYRNKGIFKIMTKREIAELLSGADFEKVKNELSENIEWNIYEESMFIKGRQAVIDFSDKVKDYFQTITTDFKTTGVIEDDNKIAIYGQAEFIRDGEIINKVNSCDVYEFDAGGKVSTVHSYCNSKKPS